MPLTYCILNIDEDFTGSRQRVVCFCQESNEPFHIFDRIDIE